MKSRRGGSSINAMLLVMMLIGTYLAWANGYVKLPVSHEKLCEWHIRQALVQAKLAEIEGEGAAELNELVRQMKQTMLKE